MLSDFEIIEKLVEGSRIEKDEVIEEIYSKWSMMARSIFSKFDKGIVEFDEIFQESIVIFYQNIISGRFEGRSNLKTYFLAIFKNICYQENRNISKRTLIKEVVKDESVEVNAELLRNIVSKMNFDCFKILSMFYYDSFSMEEIKYHFNLGSIQAAKNKKYRCLQGLMKKVKEAGLEYSSFIS